MISAAIYDMDGLIIDSEPLWRKAEIEAFAPFGLELTEDMCRQTMGLRVDEVVQYWFSRHLRDREDYPRAAASIMENVVALIIKQGEALPGVTQSLDFFRSKNMKLALASSSDLNLIETVLNKFHIRDYFEVVHSAQFEPYGKPHPGVYITTAEKLGVSPLECVALEDSVNGMISAKAARMKCIGVPDREILSDKRLGIADIIIPSLTVINDGLWSALGGLTSKKPTHALPPSTAKSALPPVHPA